MERGRGGDRGTGRDIGGEVKREKGREDRKEME
jgi:hypothetical protein